ncbi:RNA-guided endonuclease TnpB family protein [Nitrosococcus watsonii]|uniref:RNA-guided endonuclease TnpB family protein n=1 Tax=Nitrosococcus watsonii TaxID=473531 RepID=UPI00059DC5C7|nr:RNA-guided endonuclease TnpB family protein [Nitrosococcus watsonii]
MKAYQLRLYPTLKQRRQLEKEFSACRYVWNWALDRRTRAYKEKGESLNAIALSRELTALKLAKAARGGHNRRKQRSRVARLHQRIASKRANFLHGLSTSIVRENQAIAIEDLNVRGMMANGKLARSVGDCGWYELRRQLTYKAKWYGRQLNVVPRFQRTTGVCPDCGTVGEKLPLRVRSWTCGHCGSAHDRDIAAARVIDLMGNTARSVGIDACGLAHKPEEAVTP